MSVVRKALESIDWTGKQLLVACSGGLDSTVLLHSLIAMGLKPEVLHVNYQLRDADSEADETFVRDLAKKYGLNLQVHRCPKDYLKGDGINLQAAARDFRRQLFADWKALSPRHIVVLAHHADDQLETFFLQLCRGSGTFGLGGMHVERDRLLRPFLDCSKEELRAYAESNQVSWREDSSNAATTYLRNRWRNELLPELLEQLPTLRESTLLMMRYFRDHQAELITSIEPLADTWKANHTLGIEDWQVLTDEQKVAFAHQTQLPVWVVSRFNELCDRPVSSRVDLGEGEVIREKSTLIYKFDRTKKRQWDFKIEEIGILPDAFDKTAIYIDPLKLKGDLKLRPWVSGDRIQSKGLNGSQLVSDVLKDAGIPFSERSEVPVLTDGEDILWIPGLKIGKTALAEPTSTRIWQIIILHA